MESPNLELFHRFVDALERIDGHLGRLVDHIDPPPSDVVDTTYVAKRIGCTTDWIANLAATGEIPSRCVVTGTGAGKPWKFHRRLIEAWIEAR